MRSRSNSSNKQSNSRDTSNIKKEVVQDFLNSPDDDEIPQFIDQNNPNNNENGKSIRGFLSRVITDNLSQSTPRRIPRISSPSSNRSPEFEALHPNSATQSSEASYTMPPIIKKLSSQTSRHSETFPSNQDIIADTSNDVQVTATFSFQIVFLL